MQHPTLIKTILSFGFLFNALFAQPTPDFLFQRIGLESGLPTEHVTAITQDSLGFMWIGTANGLCRYDGESIKTYTSDPADSSSLFSNHIQSLYTDQSGNIWIGAGGLNRYDAELDKFIRYQFTDLPNAKRALRFPHVMKEDQYGYLWIGTFGYGLFKLHIASGKIQKVDLGEHRRDSPIGRIIYSLFIDQEDSVWVTSSGRQLTVIDLKTERQVRHYWQDETDIQFLFNDSRGEKWLRRDRDRLKKLRLKKNGTVEITPFKGGVDYQGYGKVAEDLNGRLWLGTIEQGICIVNPESGRSYWERFSSAKSHSLSHNFIEDLYRDQDGNIWIATKNGISVYSHWSKQFKHYRHDTEDRNSLNNALVTGIKQAKDGTVWISTLFKGFCRFDPDNETFTRFEPFIPGTKSFWALDIFPDSKGQVWIAGNLQSGLNHFNVDNNTYVNYRHNRDDSTTIGSNGINQIYEDRFGKIWVATNGGGLNLFQPETGQFVRFQTNETDQHTPPSNNVTVLNQTNDSLLFLGTDFGIGVMHLPSLTVKRLKHAVEGSFIIHTLYNQKSEKRMWLGTNRGLYYFDLFSEKIRHADSSIGDLNEEVYGILEDDTGSLWLQLPDALMRYSPQNKNIRKYGRASGWIQNSAFESGWRHSAEKLSNGEMLFGGINGITRFHPDQILDNTEPSPVHISGFRLFYEPVTLDNNPRVSKESEERLLERPVRMTDNLTLNYYQNTFSFEFTTLDYTRRDAIRYAYKLEGFHADWVYPVGENSATFTNLSPGEYVFRVRGKNSDGIWNDSGDSMNILILTPWWQTGWAYATFILLALGALYLLWRMQTQRFMLNSQLQMRSFEAEKLKELDTLKSRFFANISHEFRTPLTLILGPIDSLQQKQPDTASTEQLGIMKRNALRLQQLINQLLDLSRLESQKMELQVQPGDLPGFLRGLIMSFASLAEQKKIKLLIDLPPQTKTSSYFDADKLEKIITNLLSNAFKFTPELGTISIKATIDKNLKLTVTDSGIGIAPEEQNFIFERFRQVESGLRRGYEGSGIGLSLVKEMVDLYGGEITLESEPGKGATFYVDLPVSREAFSDDVVHEAIIAPVHTEQSAILTSSTENLPADSKGKPDSTLPLILIVDDHQDVRTFIRRQLEDSYRLIEADTGLSGLEKSFDAIPDLIISDVMMPEMDGYEFCEKLKTDERTSHVPVILLTARAGDEDKLTGLETGADDYLTKPFNSAELLIRVRNLIASRETLRKHFLNDWLKRGEQLPVSSTEAEFLKKLREALDENLANEHFGIDQLADLLGIGKRQLQRKIRALTNETAGSLIRAARLEKAKHLLESNAGTVSEIAYDVGFNHLSYFARCYRERFGISPSDVRKNA